jgi:hypothetical protein
MKTSKLIAISALLVLALALSACGSKEPETPTPTPVDVNAIAVQAIQTFSMQLTMTAFAQPTATQTPIPTATIGLQPTFVVLGTNTSAAAVSTCDVTVFTGVETIPDGTVMTPGQSFIKKWNVQNGGTCTWKTTYKFAYTGVGNGGPMGGAGALLPREVKPGETIELAVSLVAPTTAGDYTSWWALQNDKGEFFRTWISVVIKVAGAAPKSPTPTETTTSP